MLIYSYYNIFNTTWDFGLVFLVLQRSKKPTT